MHKSTTPHLLQTIWPRWTSRQFHPPIVQTLIPVTFGYSLSSKAVIMRQLRRWKRLWRRSLTRSHKRTSRGHSRTFWNGSTSALQVEEITSKGNRVSWVYYQWKCPYEKSLETYLMILVCLSDSGRVYMVLTEINQPLSGLISDEIWYTWHQKLNSLKQHWFWHWT